MKRDRHDAEFSRAIRERDALKLDNERLRASLGYIHGLVPGMRGVDYTHSLELIRRMDAVAVAALAGMEPQ